LQDEENLDILASFMDPLPKKKLKTDSEDNSITKKDISSDKNENGEDDLLACDEDDFGERSNDNKGSNSSGHEVKGTWSEYSVRKNLILRKFINILGQLDKKFSQSNSELEEFDEASSHNKNGLDHEDESQFIEEGPQQPDQMKPEEPQPKPDHRISGSHSNSNRMLEESLVPEL